LDGLERQLEELGSNIVEPGGDADQRLQYVGANRDFHMAIANASGNMRLARMVASLLEEASRYVYIESSHVGRLGVEESLAVVLAMRRGEALAARAAMEVHLRATYDRALRALAYSSDGWLAVGEG
jgi:DNA-binding GntR family transcriptional regulator